MSRPQNVPCPRKGRVLNDGCSCTPRCSDGGARYGSNVLVPRPTTTTAVMLIRFEQNAKSQYRRNAFDPQLATLAPNAHRQQKAIALYGNVPGTQPADTRTRSKKKNRSIEVAAVQQLVSPVASTGRPPPQCTRPHDNNALLCLRPSRAPSPRLPTGGAIELAVRSYNMLPELVAIATGAEKTQGLCRRYDTKREMDQGRPVYLCRLCLGRGRILPKTINTVVTDTRYHPYIRNHPPHKIRHPRGNFGRF